jgi:hypothetical protein
LETQKPKKVQEMQLNEPQIEKYSKKFVYTDKGGTAERG